MRSAPQEQWIWYWPIRGRLALAVLAILNAMFLVPEVPGIEPSEAFNWRLGAMLHGAVTSFIVGFFATVILLTYVRVAERER